MVKIGLSLTFFHPDLVFILDCAFRDTYTYIHILYRVFVCSTRLSAVLFVVECLHSVCILWWGYTFFFRLIAIGLLSVSKRWLVSSLPLFLFYFLHFSPAARRFEYMYIFSYLFVIVCHFPGSTVNKWIGSCGMFLPLYYCDSPRLFARYIASVWESIFE